jgi:hypothetical protein
MTLAKAGAAHTNSAGRKENRHIILKYPPNFRARAHG